MKKKFSFKIKIPPVLWALVAVVLVFSVSVGAMLAYLKMSSAEVRDNFTVAADYPIASADVLDDWCIMVGSTPVPDDSYSVYVRAVANAMWKDSNGHVVNGVPDGCDSTSSVNTVGGWLRGSDGYYYYSLPVPYGGTTAPLFASFSKNEANGYTLTVNVFAQTIQAVGSTDAETPVAAVNDAWGNAVKVNDDGTLILNN